MALNFNLLNPDLPGQIAGSFQQGYQGAQDRANVLAQRQQQRQIADMEMQNALRVQKDAEARRNAYGATNPIEVANRLRGAGFGEEAMNLEQKNREQVAQVIRDGAKTIAANPSSYKSVFQRVKQTAGIPLDDDEKRYDEAFATGGEAAVRKLAAADAQLSTQVVGGSIYNPATGEFTTPQKQSSKLVPILVGGQPVLVPEEQAVGQIPANAQTMRGLGGGRASAGGASATGRAPSGYRFTSTGELEPIPGGPAASKAEGGESFLTRKEMEKREASLPKATQSVKIVGNTMSTIEETVDRLLNNAEGLNGITGLIYGRTPGVTDASRQAEADLNQLKNLAFVQGLTELREASKTGAGVGNVSNKEGERFENLKASLDRTQSRESLSQALLRLKAQAQFTKQSLQDAFDDTYQYRSGQSTNVPVALTGAKPTAKTTAPNIDALLEKYK